VTTGAYRAVEFIKAKSSSWKVPQRPALPTARKSSEICTKYAQKGMLNIFHRVFFATLAFAFVDFLLHPAIFLHRIFGLYQASSCQRRRRVGQRQENRRSRDEAEGTPLHDATVIGDTVGDPFKDTSSVRAQSRDQVQTLSSACSPSNSPSNDRHPRLQLDARPRGRFLCRLFVFVYRSFTACASGFGA